MKICAVIYRRSCYLWSLLLMLMPLSTFAQETGTKASPATAEGVVRELYDLVTFEAGATPDWDAVRDLFVPEAVIVLRTTRDASTQFTLEGFVQDFVNFIERAEVEKTGFREEIIRLRPMVFGDIAQVLVLYEASIPGWERPPQQGVDSFQLIHRDGRWWIVSILNEIPTPERPLPEALRE